jgi:hypothetical protein
VPILLAAGGVYLYQRRQRQHKAVRVENELSWGGVDDGITQICISILWITSKSILSSTRAWFPTTNRLVCSGKIRFDEIDTTRLMRCISTL